jgi:hypothetical protein
MAFGAPGKKLGRTENRQKQKGNNFLHEASDYEDESISARGAEEKFLMIVATRQA